MLLFSIDKACQYEITPLLSSTCLQADLEQIAKWIQDKWGYIRGNTVNLTKRIEMISKMQDKFYTVKHHDQLIGMFALMDYPLPHQSQNKANLSAKELMYVYVDERVRGFGIGRKIVETAKKICSLYGYNMMVLDTLNPNLNHFYEKCGAKVVADNLLLGHPTTFLRI